MKIISEQIILAICFLAVTTGCQARQENQIATVSDESCIASFDQFAFTVPKQKGLENRKQVPQAPWQIEAEVPVEGDYLAEVEISRMVENTTEIWLSNTLYGSDFNYSVSKPIYFLRYLPDAQEWTSVSAQVKHTDIYVDTLFVGPEGEIWGRNVWAYDNPIEQPPVLSKFDEAREEFVLEKRMGEIPHGCHHESTTIDELIWDQVVLDQKGNFWIFACQDAVYRFNPESGEVNRHADISGYEMIYQPTISVDGSIFFLQNILSEKLVEGHLLRFSPETGTIKEVDIQKNRWLIPNGLLIDRRGRLWLDANGWVDPEGDWHTLNPRMRALFREIMVSDQWVYYYPPEVFFESSDGRLWFRIEKSNQGVNYRTGMAWYNPQTSEGCWFTSESTNIIEDSNQNLWMVVDGYLYENKK
jgi:hypothetical protein